MAKTVSQPKSPEDSAAQAAEELSIICPDIVIPIGDSSVTVTEYRFMQWLDLKQRADNLVFEFSLLIEDPNDVLLDDVLQLLEEKFADVVFLMGQSINKPDEFFKALTNAEMDLLQVTWWNVNKHFFIRAAIRQIRARKRHMETAAQNHPDGRTSSSV